MFSKRFAPTIKSNNFKDYKIENFQVNYDKNRLKVEFDCENYMDYLICIYSNNEEIVLDRISEENGITYYQLDNQFNKKYTYSITDLGYIDTDDLRLNNVLKTQVINANMGVNIFINNKSFYPKDANGNYVIPFVYNGTTYLILTIKL